MLGYRDGDKVMSVRLDAETVTKLEALAKADMRSQNQIITLAIREKWDRDGAKAEASNV